MVRYFLNKLNSWIFGSSSKMASEDDLKWKDKLTPEQYHVTREKGTERVGSYFASFQLEAN